VAGDQKGGGGVASALAEGLPYVYGDLLSGIGTVVFCARLSISPLMSDAGSYRDVAADIPYLYR
jgi:hypothetical protein